MCTKICVILFIVFNIKVIRSQGADQYVHLNDSRAEICFSVNNDTSFDSFIELVLNVAYTTTTVEAGVSMLDVSQLADNTNHILKYEHLATETTHDLAVWLDGVSQTFSKSSQPRFYYISEFYDILLIASGNINLTCSGENITASIVQDIPLNNVADEPWINSFTNRSSNNTSEETEIETISQKPDYKDIVLIPESQENVTDAEMVSFVTHEEFWDISKYQSTPETLIHHDVEMSSTSYVDELDVTSIATTDTPDESTTVGLIASDENTLVEERTETKLETDIEEPETEQPTEAEEPTAEENVHLETKPMENATENPASTVKAAEETTVEAIIPMARNDQESSMVESNLPDTLENDMSEQSPTKQSKANTTLIIVLVVVLGGIFVAAVTISIVFHRKKKKLSFQGRSRPKDEYKLDERPIYPGENERFLKTRSQRV